MSAHRGNLTDYRMVVDVRRHGGRATPIYGTRLLASCSCGWSVAGVDFISARRAWKRHVAAVPADTEEQT